MKYFYENNEIFSFLTSRLLFSVSRSRLLFIVMERAMMMMMMMMMMMKEVELVVEMRSASCRTDLQGLQLLLSAVPASAALTFLSAHSKGWIFLQEILNFPSSYKNLFFQMTLEHNIFFKISFIFRQNPPKICPFLICKSQYTPVLQ